ncbi:phosphoribosylformylglycinamidine cyclo-ligase [Desulfonatronospira sp.]|uniref:phosphoribosylformylglycinamidine cyclo-ligase n=1 Tax=Desulfonatronospira sp. TaxID=1962951 RepID=UPI0025BDDC97|nr:phosphoribosylformylglycinamidine cyclo-ligase [Desulfonatronospira sp.]
MTSRGEAYLQAGVDTEKAGRFVDSIKNIVARTRIKGVITDIGGFGGLFKLDMNELNEPVLVASADGVGTKLKLAFLFDRHDTIGIDLVAMSVNDVLVQGARPLFFLDYLATGKLETRQAEEIVKGVARGCIQAGCALLGGETAEMPDFYPPGEYDLSGFCVGVVDDSRIVDGGEIRPDDAVIGLASSGLHSNGYSLVRKILSQSGLEGSDILPGTSREVRDVLLEPARIYTAEVKGLMRDIKINGMAHITGGGFYDNIPRMLHRGLGARIKFGTWEIPAVMHWVKDQGEIMWEDMLQIFNCGIGYVLVVSRKNSEEVCSRLKGMGCPAWEIGRIIEIPRDSENIIVEF